MKKYLAILSAAALTLGLVAVVLVAGGSAKAADFIAPTGDNGTVTVNRTETHHNLYVVGGDVSVNSPTTGDLYAAGGSVSIDGSVEQDLVVAGGVVTISEPVNGDVRVAGGKVTLNAPIKGDVLVGAGTLVINDKASIGGELRASGGTVVVNGPVSGGAYFMGGKITLNSKIDGNVKVTASNALVFGPQADIASEVSYIGKQNATVTDGAKVNVAFTALEQHQRDSGKRTGFIGFLLGGVVIKIVAFILAGLLFLNFFPKKAAAVTESMRTRPWANLGVGFAVAVATPIAAILAIVILVGYYVALIVLAAYILAIFISLLVGSIFVGSWIIKLLTKKPHMVLDWQAVVLGTIIITLLAFVPVVGWLIELGVFLIAFGSVISFHWASIKQSRGAAGQIE